MALGAGVGAELGVAADAHRLAFVADEPLPPEVLPTVETVRAVCHRHSSGDSELQRIDKEQRKSSNPAEETYLKPPHGGNADILDLYCSTLLMPFIPHSGIRTVPLKYLIRVKV